MSLGDTLQALLTGYHVATQQIRKDATPTAAKFTGSISTGTVEVGAYNTYPYTFVNGGQDNWDGEESVPEECNFGTPSAPERHVEVEDQDVILDIVSPLLSGE